MSANTAIEWAHHTFNPWWGCEKVSPACAHCYAEAFSKRVGHDIWGADTPRRFFSDAHWNEPRKWDRLAGDRGVRERVFCASMADVLENRADLDGARQRLFELISETPNLIWMLLTKRPENADGLMPAAWFDGEWPGNCWFGITVENQTWFERRIVAALKVPAPIHFLSMEPLLGPVDFGLHLGVPLTTGDRWFGALPGIDLVIAGGESGSKARPSHPDWFRSLRDQCVDASVSFFFKQWGEWVPAEQLLVADDDLADRIAAGRVQMYPFADSLEVAVRVGKKHAGRELDGRTWDQMPEVARV